MQILTGHTDENTAYAVDDYPYGFRLRTKIRYWVETRENMGQRFCSQTLNPKTGNWNKPKCSTYSPIILLGINSENGYVERVDYPTGYGTKIEDLENWYRQYHQYLDLYQLKQVQISYATFLAKQAVKNNFPEITIGNYQEYGKAVYQQMPIQVEYIRQNGLDNLILVKNEQTEAV